MSSLTPIEKRTLEGLFQMGGGYVLDFSNRTLAEFFTDTLGIEIYGDKYNYASGSKANRLRRFWAVEPDDIVARLLAALVEYAEESNSGSALLGKAKTIVDRLRLSAPVQDIDAISPGADGEESASPEKTVRSLRQSFGWPGAPDIRPTDRTTAHRLRVFLCHASEDKPRIRRLFHRLEKANMRPWLDEEHIMAGQRWKDVIEDAIEKADAFIVCLSQSAVNKEGYVHHEIKVALDRMDRMPEGRVFLIPLLLDPLEPSELPRRFREIQHVKHYADGGFNFLLRSLGALAGLLQESGSKVKAPSTPASPTPRSPDVVEHGADTATERKRLIELEAEIQRDHIAGGRELIEEFAGAETFDLEGTAYDSASKAQNWSFKTLHALHEHGCEYAGLFGKDYPSLRNEALLNSMDPSSAAAWTAKKIGVLEEIGRRLRSAADRTGWPTDGPTRLAIGKARLRDRAHELEQARRWSSHRSDEVYALLEACADDVRILLGADAAHVMRNKHWPDLHPTLGTAVHEDGKREDQIHLQLRELATPAAHLRDLAAHTSADDVRPEFHGFPGTKI